MIGASCQGEVKAMLGKLNEVTLVKIYHSGISFHLAEEGKYFDVCLALQLSKRSYYHRRYDLMENIQCIPTPCFSPVQHDVSSLISVFLCIPQAVLKK